MGDTPHQEGNACLTPTLEPQLIMVGDTGLKGVTARVFFPTCYKYTHIYIYIAKTYITADSEWQNKKENGKAMGQAASTHRHDTVAG
jgi:hypothetical protein